jgi:hypothetical protein
MKLRFNVVLAGLVGVAGVMASASTADAGLFAKLFGKKCCAPEPECCEPEPVCCEPEPVCCEPEPVCCEPAPEPVCCEPAPEPVCCEPEPEPVCCEPEPAPEPCCEEPAPEEPCCASNLPLPTLAEGEILLSISPILTPIKSTPVLPKSSEPSAVALVSVSVGK